MIVCKKCGALNEDLCITCKDCRDTLTKSDIYEYNRSIEKIKLDRANKSKKKKTTKLALSVIYFIVILALLVLNIISNKESITLIATTILMILSGYICITRPELIFIVTHLFSIKDVNEGDMSDMYETLTIVFGYLIYTYALINLILNYIEGA
ncbi:hypothetical protein [Clostridium sardiniense]|uniref:hypothetical protein n=1 Tax=Clostridium sardiniense TaxID=29369 RepID=UPI003D34C049